MKQLISALLLTISVNYLLAQNQTDQDPTCPEYKCGSALLKQYAAVDNTFSFLEEKIKNSNLYRESHNTNLNSLATIVKDNMASVKKQLDSIETDDGAPRLDYDFLSAKLNTTRRLIEMTDICNQILEMNKEIFAASQAICLNQLLSNFKNPESLSRAITEMTPNLEGVRDYNTDQELINKMVSYLERMNMLQDELSFN